MSEFFELIGFKGSFLSFCVFFAIRVQEILTEYLLLRLLQTVKCKTVLCGSVHFPSAFKLLLTTVCSVAKVVVSGKAATGIHHRRRDRLSLGRQAGPPKVTVWRARVIDKAER